MSSAARDTGWQQVQTRRREKVEETPRLDKDSYHTIVRQHDGMQYYSFVCDICNIACTGLSPLQQHQKGRKHQEVWLAMQSGQPELPKAQQKPPVQGVAHPRSLPGRLQGFSCRFCKLQLGSALALTWHAATVEHRQQVSAAVRQAGSYGPPSGGIMQWAWRCYICNTPNPSQKHLQAHLMGSKHRVQIQKDFFCDLCSCIFRDSGEMEAHQHSARHCQRLQDLQHGTLGWEEVEGLLLQNAGLISSSSRPLPGQAASNGINGLAQDNLDKLEPRNAFPANSGSYNGSNSLPDGNQAGAVDGKVEQWSILDGFKCPMPTWETGGSFQTLEGKASSSSEGAAQATALLPEDVNPNFSTEQAPESPGSSSGLGAQGAPTAAAAPSSADEEFLAELLGNLLGPPQPLQQPPGGVPPQRALPPPAPAAAAPTGASPAQQLYVAQQGTGAGKRPVTEATAPVNPLAAFVICPLSKATMTDPVLANDGHTYERAAILRWMADNKTSPMTGEPLTDTKLTPNVLVKQALLGLLKV